MQLIGFSFQKVSVEKFSPLKEGLKINTKIDISNIEKIKTDFFKGKGDILEIKFTYDIEYDPKIAKIEIAGTVLLEVDSKDSKEILKQWKNKKISEKFRIPLFNIILRKSNVKALQLEEEMNLPLHIPLPSLKPQNTQENK